MNSNDENIDSTPDQGDRIPTDRRPLGFWLRVVDARLTDEFAQAFQAEGVTRREWMLLNLIDGDVAPGLPEGLAERFARKAARGGKRLDALEERGWITRADDGWALTDEGRAAKERLGALADGLRTRVAGAVSPEDFATTMASLEAIARELGWDESAPMPRRGFGRRGRGFRPGFGPGHPGMFGGFGPGAGPVPPHVRHGWGDPGRAEFGHNAHHGRPGHPGDHGCDPEGRRHRGRGHRGAERAYERGFDAGFARGRADGSNTDGGQAA